MDKSIYIYNIIMYIYTRIKTNQPIVKRTSKNTNKPILFFSDELLVPRNDTIKEAT